MGMKKKEKKKAEQMQMLELPFLILFSQPVSAVFFPACVFLLGDRGLGGIGM